MTTRNIDVKVPTGTTVDLDAIVRDVVWHAIHPNDQLSKDLTKINNVGAVNIKAANIKSKNTILFKGINGQIPLDAEHKAALIWNIVNLKNGKDYMIKDYVVVNPTTKTAVLGKTNYVSLI